MAKKAPDAWVIEKDEFHPDLREAAKHADQQARLFIRKELKARVAVLEAQPMKNAYELAELVRSRNHLDETEAKIKEYEHPDNDPEG